jgi:hypothetical protein
MNWKQELAAEVTALEDVNANTATLLMRIDTLNEFYGEEARVVELVRSLRVAAPSPVNLRLVDGTNYLAGDFVCKVSFAELKKAFAPIAGDPEIIINGITKTLAEIRPFTAQGNWGVDIGDDKLVIGGDKWTIAGVRGLNWLDNEPAVFEFTLRS